MANVFVDLMTISRTATVDVYGPEDGRAWRNGDCSQCGGTQLAVIAQTQMRSGVTQVAWLRCPSCGQAIVSNGGRLSPARQPMSVPEGLPPTEAAVWAEVRACLSVGGYTAAVMLCRKLLFHIAVTHDMPEKKENGRAPTFVEAVDHLQSQGLITPRMRPWVDRVKDVGNEANHEITPVEQSIALDMARFTEQLLRLAFEMDALMAAAEPAPGDDSAAATAI